MVKVVRGKYTSLNKFCHGCFNPDSNKFVRITLQNAIQHPFNIVLDVWQIS